MNILIICILPPYVSIKEGYIEITRRLVSVMVCGKSELLVELTTFVVFDGLSHVDITGIFFMWLGS